MSRFAALLGLATLTACGADLAVMAADAYRMRRGAPTLFTSLVEQPAAPDVASWLEVARRSWLARAGQPVA